MDALEELREMHVAAKQAFRKIDGASPTERGGLWAKLRPELELHERIEEQFVYDPVARDVGQQDPTLRSWESEHESQAREADGVIAKIGELDPTDDRWMSEFRSLVSMLDRHIAHEENDIWPKIRDEWGGRNLEQAGKPIAVAKKATTSGSSVEDAFKQALQASGAR